jgi:hypothetical protein
MQDGNVGIHRPYLEVPKDEVSPNKVSEHFQKTLQEIRAYFREMNVSEQLADAMLRIPPRRPVDRDHASEDERYSDFGFDVRQVICNPPWSV